MLLSRIIHIVLLEELSTKAIAYEPSIHAALPLLTREQCQREEPIIDNGTRVYGVKECFLLVSES